MIDAHYVLARALHDMKAEAALELDEVKDLTAREQDAIQSARLSNEGLVAGARGDMAAALKLEQQAVELKPDYGVAHLNLGLILADKENWKSARRELVQAASLLPGRAEPWFDLGRVMQREGDLESARAVLAWAAKLAPEAATAAHAGSALQPALGAQGDTASAHLAFANRLLAAGDFSGALGELLRVLTVDPANVEARCHLARAYAQLGKKARAELELHKALLVDPANLQAKAALTKLRTP